MSTIIAYFAEITTTEEYTVYTAYGQALLNVDEDGNPLPDEEEQQQEGGE